MRLFRLLLFTLCAPLAQAYLRLKFHHWFPAYEHIWLKAAATPECQSRLRDYYTDNHTRCSTPCACAADCLLANVTGTIQSNFASAQVILGLLPSVLMFVGPTIAEIAVLSSSQPLLASLVALGSPATSVLRLFNQVNIKEPLDRKTSQSLVHLLDWFNRQHRSVRRLWKGLSYLIILAAIANNTRNSVYIDLRTISGWRCATLLLPLAWSSANIIVQIPGMIAIRTRRLELTIASRILMTNSELHRKISSSKDTVSSEILFGISSVLATADLMFGTLVLSSLVFISTEEALEAVVLYAISVLACQCVLAVELAEMRRDQEENGGSKSSTHAIP